MLLVRDKNSSRLKYCYNSYAAKYDLAQYMTNYKKTNTRFIHRKYHLWLFYLNYIWMHFKSSILRFPGFKSNDDLPI